MIVFAVFSIILLAIVGKMGFLVLFRSHSYEEMVLSSQGYTSTPISFKPGNIYDTNGNVLAGSRKLYRVVLEPKNIIGLLNSKGEPLSYENRNEVAKCLDQFLGVPEPELLAILKTQKNSQYYPYVTNRMLTEEEAQEMKDYLEKERVFVKEVKVKNKKTGKTELKKQYKKIEGVYLEESYERTYPYNRTACHLLGYTTDDFTSVGGIEQQYKNYLMGKEGRRFTYLNEKGEYDSSITEPVHGQNVVTTVDVNIQKIAEKYLERIQDDYGSKNTSVLVMNPNNGEVLAMANSKTFDPNKPMDDENLSNYYDLDDIDKNLSYYIPKKKLKKMTEAEKKTEAYNTIWNNYVISSTYEPGSTFKPFNVAMALENGSIDETAKYKCTGSKTVGGSRIGCSHYHGTIPLSTTIAMSCNVAMMDIAEATGAKAFAKYQRAFGFGSLTGIDLPGEASASNVLHDENMADVDLATSSFGQSFQCTMIQLGSAFCSLINGGNYYQPHIVKQVLDEDGNVEVNVEKTLMKKTVSKETSDKLKTYMRETVTSGTARRANIRVYDIAGKTGTAEKLPRGTGKRLVSFIGFADDENPEIMVYMTIDELQRGGQSNTGLAVGAVRDIIKDSLDYMHKAD